MRPTGRGDGFAGRGPEEVLGGKRVPGLSTRLRQVACHGRSRSSGVEHLCSQSKAQPARVRSPQSPRKGTLPSTIIKEETLLRGKKGKSKDQGEVNY